MISGGGSHIFGGYTDGLTLLDFPSATVNEQHPPRPSPASAII